MCMYVHACVSQYGIGVVGVQAATLHVTRLDHLLANPLEDLGMLHLCNDSFARTWTDAHMQIPSVLLDPQRDVFGH
jgi:hypothetical protein